MRFSADVELLRYVNVPQSIGSVVSRKLASLVELDSVLGVEDLYNLLEIIAIDNHNQYLVTKNYAHGD